MLGPGKPSGLPAKTFNPLGPPSENRVPPAGTAQGGEAASPLRNVGFRMALVLVFIYFSNIHQLLAYVLHVNLFLLYLFGIPTLLGVVLAGGIQRTLRGRPAIYWTIFVVLLLAGIPFSSWRSGAVDTLIPYLRTVFPMLFVIAGLALTWRECRSMMWAIAAGGAVIMTAAKLFQDTSSGYGDRLAIEFGTIANSNDYAVHLLFVLPFVIWVALGSKSKALQLVAWGVVCFGVLLVLRTASRGAFLGLVSGVLYWLFRGTMRQKLGLLIVGPIAVVALAASVPRSSLIRIVSFSAADDSASEEALESSEMRRYLLEKSIAYTLQNPVFGLGMGQFNLYEGLHNQVVGTHGMWHQTHNTFTQVSSECGIPALALYIAGIVSTFLMVNRVYRQACGRPDCEDIRIATFCIMLAMTTYCTGMIFVNFAYFFYLPVMSSLAIAVSHAAQNEFACRCSSTVGIQVGFAPQQLWSARWKRVAPGATPASRR